MTQIAQLQPGLDAIRRAWKAANLVPLWESPTAHKPPPAPTAAHLWQWSILRPLVDHALAIAAPDAVERRVLSLVNPAAQSVEDEATTRNLSAAIQSLLPGEAARPHRHSMNALRFVLEGNGAVTLVNGKSCAMNQYDLILTPAWCWHAHVHHGDAPIIWLDALDVPLHLTLGTVAFQPGPVKNLPASLDDAMFAVANILPDITLPDHDYSPVYRYSHEAATAAVTAAPVGPDGTRRVKFTNPATGGAAMGLMDCKLLQIDPGVTSVPARSNCNAICVVVEGSGESRIGDQLLNWRQNDIFTVPQHQWYTHHSAATARIFVTSDRELYARLGILTEELQSGG